MKLENKVIAITGAGGIICSEFAKALGKPQIFLGSDYAHL